MLFPKKVRRVLDIDKAEKEFKEDFRREELEKSDVPAMIFAALLVFLPAALIVTLVMIGIPYFIFS